MHAANTMPAEGAPEGFEPADEALFCTEVPVDELDAWDPAQLDELHGTVHFYAAAAGL